MHVNKILLKIWESFLFLWCDKERERERDLGPEAKDLAIALELVECLSTIELSVSVTTEFKGKPGRVSNVC